MEQLASLTLSIAMIGVFLLSAGGVWLVTKKRDYRKGGLMIAAAFVLLVNVLMWTV